MLSYLRARLHPSPVEENFEQWVSNRFGHRLYRIFFKTYTEKVWGLPCTEIRAEWAAQRIQGLSLASALRSAIPLQKRSPDVRSLIEKFKYPRLGPGQMWERCGELLRQIGGELHLNHRISAFELEGDKVVAARASTPAGEQRFEAEHFISTMPLTALVQSLGLGVPDMVRTAARELGLTAISSWLLSSWTSPDSFRTIGSTSIRLASRWVAFKTSTTEVPRWSRTRTRLAWAWSTSAPRAMECGRPTTRSS